MKFMKSVGLALTIVALAAPSWASPTLSSLVLQSDHQGAPGDIVAFFKPGDRKQHFTVKFDSLKVGKTKIKMNFVGVETSAGRNVAVKELELTALVANEAHAMVSLPRDWPFGDYKMDVYVDGKLAKSCPYVVSPAVSELKALGIALHKDDGKGGVGPRVSKFSSTGRVLHFVLEVNGYLMAKSEVVWVFTAVDTTAGKNVKITEQKKSLDIVKGNQLTSSVSLPRDWPVGTYRVEAALNGRSLGQFPFEVSK